MIPGRVLLDLAARFTPQPPPPAPHSAPTGPAGPGRNTGTIRVSPPPPRRSARRSKVRYTPPAPDWRELERLAVYTATLGDPLTAARALFAPDLLEDR